MAQLFCDRCLAESQDSSPGDVHTINGVGRQFYGGADPCPTCASVIRTLWWTFIDVPLIPLGSYRYKTADVQVLKVRFWARRTALHWRQVITTWVVGLAIAAAAIAAIAIYESRKR